LIKNKEQNQLSSLLIELANKMKIQTLRFDLEYVKVWVDTVSFMVLEENFNKPYFNLNSREKFIGMDQSKSPGMMISLDGRSVKSLFYAQFSSAIANYPVKTGKWYYEVELFTNTLFQIGWCTKNFKSDSILSSFGVGDDVNSWAVDLYRNYIWHIHSECYGNDAWNIGGILQVYLDCDERIMSFGYNGNDLGPAFTDFPIEDVGLYPAFSADADNELRFNWGETSFTYPQTEYKPYFLANK